MQNLNSQTPQSENDRDSKAGDKQRLLKHKLMQKAMICYQRTCSNRLRQSNGVGEMLEEKEAKNEEWMESGVWQQPKQKRKKQRTKKSQAYLGSIGIHQSKQPVW